MHIKYVKRNLTSRSITTAFDKQVEKKKDYKPNPSDMQETMFI